MKKTEQRARVQAITSYLQGAGITISNVQGYEVLARALGLKNKHVLASLVEEPAAKERLVRLPASVTIEGVAVPVRQVGQAAYTVAEMDQLRWTFDVIIPMPLEQLGDIDAMNDAASEVICGNSAALENLVYAHVPEVNYGEGYVAYRVTAYISQPETHFEEMEDKADEKFYQGLANLAEQLSDNTFAVLTMARDGTGQHRIVTDVNPALLAMLKQYAATRGANNDQMNLHAKEVVFVLTYRYSFGTVNGIPQSVPVRLEQLKYAQQEGQFSWWMNDDTNSVLMNLKLHH